MCESCEIAEEKDVKELFELQLRAFESEAEMTGSRNVPALMESFEENQADFKNWTVLVKRNEDGDIIGAVRFKKEGDHVEIGRVMVDRRYRNRGIASGLMTAVEELTQDKAFELYTCTKSYININLYEKLGYKIYKVVRGDRDLSFAYMRKELPQWHGKEEHMKLKAATKKMTVILLAAAFMLTLVPLFGTDEAYSVSDQIDISELSTEDLTVTLVGATYDSTINGTGGWCYTYTGSAIRPDVSILYKTGEGTYKELKCYEDYNISNDDYVNNVNVGVATMTIHGIHDFKGEIQRSFFITQKAITPTIVLSSYSVVYNGNMQVPGITVKDGDRVLTLGTDYTLAVTAGRKNVGQYIVQANLKGNYTGKNRTSYNIIPKSTSIYALGRAKKAIKVRWKKQTAKMSSTRISGYQVQVATNKSFTQNRRTVNVKGYWRYYRKVKYLKGGTRYYVRVRTYKDVDGTRYYSKWSKVRSKITRY